MTKTLLSFYSEEDKKKLLNFRSASELLPQPAAAAVTKAMDPIKPAPAQLAVDVCEFVGDYAYPGSAGRKCTDGTYCPVSVYGKVEVFRACHMRALKLREQRKEQT